ncbi:hypothetical protein B5X24_HaOG204855 [Helicoverpa armigera]|uniref:RNA-directed DNA polymerase n=1 Tax=Helicoverpa armigera TaxID=29058 RepID=A0A2W1BMG3_HELAM|nr:hypothetical protein B5X24_HaOG204855 [Helicoverpa armigera]
MSTFTSSRTTMPRASETSPRRCLRTPTRGEVERSVESSRRSRSRTRRDDNEHRSRSHVRTPEHVHRRDSARKLEAELDHQRARLRVLERQLSRERSMRQQSTRRSEVQHQAASGERSRIVEKIDDIVTRLEKVEKTGAPSKTAVESSNNSMPAGGSGLPSISDIKNEPTVTVEKSTERALDINTGSLTGSAQSIMELYSESWKSFDDFKKDLLDVFWGSREGERAKSRLLDSTWNPNGGSTMEEYFAGLVDLVKNLRLPLEESEVVGHIIRHFPQDIQIAWFANRGTSTCEDGIKFLRNIEKNVRRQPVNVDDSNLGDRMLTKGRGYAYTNMQARGRGSTNKQFRAPAYHQGQANAIEFVQDSDQDQYDQYVVPEDERLELNVSQLSPSGPTSVCQDSSNMCGRKATEAAYRYMIRYNWSPGTSLGLSGKGIRNPIESIATTVSNYNDMRDLFFHILNQTPQEVSTNARYLSLDKVDSISAGSRPLEIVVQIKEFTLRCLINTGSQVTCIAEASYRALKNRGIQVPLMPVSPVQIHGTTKSGRVDRAALVPLVINGICIETPCLIVNNLVPEIILGMDWLEQWEATVNICGPRRSLLLNYLGKVIEINLEEDQIGCTLTDGGDSNSIEKNITSNISSETERPTSSSDKVGIEVVTLDTNVVEICYESEQNINELISGLQATVDFSLDGLRDLLIKNKRVFSVHPGRTDKYLHVIKMRDEEPFVKRSYPIPFAYRSKVEEKLKELLTLGIIKREETPYSSPLTCTLKKDGSVRILLDVRELNKRMIGEVESPPLVADILQSFNGARFITLIDLKSAYFQIPLHPDSTKYTGFTFMGKRYTFTVLPQGLKTSVGRFSRAMDVILGAEVREFCVNYLDNLVVFTKFGDLQTHLAHLDHVLGLLERANMTCSLKKCQFIKSEVQLLGHIVSPEGIRIDPGRVAAIREFPTPRTVKQLRAFLGLMNYYRRFVAKYSHMTVPFCQMLQKGTAWKWTPEVDRLFEAVKDAFIETVVLIHPDTDRIYYLQTGSSGEGVAGCLYQLDDENNERVIGFCNKALSRPEQQWTVSEQQLWAVVYGLKKFETYLRGSRVVIRTDHRNLSFINNWNLYSARVTRFILFIQQFDFTIEYVKGSNNVVPDILSRYANGVETVQELEKLCLEIAMFASCKAKAINTKIKNIIELQIEDDFCKEAIGKLSLGGCESIKQRGGELILVNGKLTFKADHSSKEALVVPRAMQAEIIEAVHEEVGHFGEARIKRLVCDRFYFPGLARMIKSVLRQCELCQKTKDPNQTTVGACKPVIATEVGEIVMADWYGPLPPGQLGMQYILVMQDVFSKYVHLYAVRRANTRIALACVRKYKSAVPIKKIVTDNGRLFTSKLWCEGMEQLGIAISHTAVRNTRPNSTRYVNKELGRLFRAYCHNSQRKWVGVLSTIGHSYNNTIHSSTGFTPCEVLKGENPKLIFDKSLGDNPDVRPLLSVEEIRKRAKDNLMKAATVRSQGHDKRYKVKTLNLGDLVKVKRDNRSDAAAKISKEFSLLYDGPYKVGGIPHANAYMLVDPVSSDVIGTYNAVHLERYYVSKYGA